MKNTVWTSQMIDNIRWGGTKIILLKLLYLTWSWSSPVSSIPIHWSKLFLDSIKHGRIRLKRILRSTYIDIICTHCCQSYGVTVALSLSHSIAVIFDQVNIKVDWAVKHRHQVRELSNALDERGKLYIKLKI